MRARAGRFAARAPDAARSGGRRGSQRGAEGDRSDDEQRPGDPAIAAGLRDQPQKQAAAKGCQQREPKPCDGERAPSLARLAGRQGDACEHREDPKHLRCAKALPLGDPGGDRHGHADRADWSHDAEGPDDHRLEEGADADEEPGAGGRGRSERP